MLFKKKKDDSKIIEETKDTKEIKDSKDIKKDDNSIVFDNEMKEMFLDKKKKTKLTKKGIFYFLF